MAATRVSRIAAVCFSPCRCKRGEEAGARSYPGGLSWDPNLGNFRTTDDYLFTASLAGQGDEGGMRHYTEAIVP